MHPIKNVCVGFINCCLNASNSAIKDKVHESEDIWDNQIALILDGRGMDTVLTMDEMKTIIKNIAKICNDTFPRILTGAIDGKLTNNTPIK